MIKILKYSFFDLIRSRWSYIYFLFYFLVSLGLLYFSSDLSKAIISLMNIVLLLTPLIGTLFGVMYYYNSREFIELLLAQPLKRTSIFLGQYLGLTLSFSLSFLLGMGLPFIFYGIGVSAEIWDFTILLLIGLLLTFIFTALAYCVAIRNENRIKGFGTAILLWLFLAIIYDGLFLLCLIFFKNYPTEKLAIGLSLFNPIDLSRILMMLKLDISALFGYTGAVFNQFFGTNEGMLVSIGFLLIWVLFPLIFFLILSKRKDF